MSSSPATLYVIAAPSGAGKTTLVRFLLDRNPDFKFSVSYTTREKREAEVDGRDYFFVDEKRFLQLKEAGQLLESALVFGNYYGTGRTQVEQQLEKGNHVILEIDWQGARLVREDYPQAISIFILPPSRETLKTRLNRRARDDAAAIAERTDQAQVEMAHWADYDYLVVNDDFETAVEALSCILSAARLGSAPQQQNLRTLLAELLLKD